MTRSARTLKTCSQGHRYRKSSDCPTCPICEAERGAKIDYTIYDAPHGMREFGVQDPDGHDIGFGEPIEQAR